MSPFSQAEAGLKRSLRTRSSSPVALLVFAFCLLVGWGLVAWRVTNRAETARKAGRNEARACATSIERQLSQTPAAAEALGMLARHGRGGITNFQRIATEWLATHPELAWIDLEPGGVVSAIVPRAGNESAIGVNVLNDLAQRAGAKEALARGVLIVTGPVKFLQGGQGIIARMPVFHRTSDGRESFWGFVAASMRLQTALRDPQDELGRKDYEFAFFIPPPSRQNVVALVSNGLSSLGGAVLEPVTVRNLEFRLALKPRGGWYDKANAAIESRAVLLFSALAALAIHLLAHHRDMGAEAETAAERLSREAAERKQAQADSRALQEKLQKTQTELEQTRLTLQKVESERRQLEARLNESSRAKDEADQSHQAERTKADAALRDARETIAHLQAQLEAAARTQKETQERLRQEQGAIAELQRQVQSTARDTRQQAEASAAKLAQLEQNNRELEERLLAADKAQARVAELTELLEEAQEQLSQKQTVLAAKAAAAPVEPDKSVKLENPEAESGLGSSAGPSESSIPVPTTDEDSSPVNEEAPLVVSHERAISASTELSKAQAAGASSSNEADLSGSAEAEKPPEKAVSEGGASDIRKLARAGRRRKTRPDNQLRLFETDTQTAASETDPAAIAGTESLPKAKDASSMQTAAPSGMASAKTDGEAETRQESSRGNSDGRKQGVGVTVEARSETGKPQLPGVEGLSTDDGLANAGGDPERYLEALRLFAEKQAGTAEKIRDALVRGDLPGAQRAVQVLRTDAEEIGATAVQKSARALAQACEQQVEPDEIESTWGEMDKELRRLMAELRAGARRKESKPAPTRHRPEPHPVDLAQLRKAVNQLGLLLAERDPGAKDCLRDNRKIFRSAFTPEAYEQFEQMLKQGDAENALEQLKKAARKHGLSV